MTSTLRRSRAAIFAAGLVGLAMTATPAVAATGSIVVGHLAPVPFWSKVPSTFTTTQCPAGSVLNGLKVYYHEGTDSGGQYRLGAGYVPQCVTADGSVVEGPQAGVATAQAGITTCGTDAAIGLYGHNGWVLNETGMVCQGLDGSVYKVPVVGGYGGATYEATCPTGTRLGGTATVANNPFYEMSTITGVSMGCQPYWTITGRGIPTKAKAGTAVPVKFTVAAGDTAVTDVADIRSVTVTSPAGTTVPVPSASGLSYDPLKAQFVVVWKTSKQDAGEYVLTITTIDGAQYTSTVLVR